MVEDTCKWTNIVDNECMINRMAPWRSRPIKLRGKASVPLLTVPVQCLCASGVPVTVAFVASDVIVLLVLCRLDYRRV